LEPSTQNRVSVERLQSKEPEVRELVDRMAHPEQTLLQALDRCARVCPPLDRALSSSLSSGLDIDGAEAWDFLTRAAGQLQRAGYWVSVPAELSRVGRRRVRPRMRIGVDPSGLDSGLMDGMVAYRWEASLGDDTLTPSEFRRLVNQNVPLIRHRGSWVAIDPEEVARLKRLMDGKMGQLAMAEALRLALSGTSAVPGSPDDTADVVADGIVASALEILTGEREAKDPDLSPPSGLEATLRPYQQRGLAWLRSVTSLNLGACLADDMGLGKTIQVIALCLDMVERRKGRHFLVICPNSVLGNWRREIERFAPNLRVVMHHGPGRSGGVMALRKLLPRDREGTVVITSYALARRDVKMLERLNFDLLVLDEAQNVKNPEAAQTQAITRLQARCRVALTGTPMENRLMELWSLMEVLNSSLL
ncbi:MAG: SNF2-related protein, partial [Myxococcota bacterium]|nr:SNF2-related protein [Myxococcota bacterium]